MAYRQFGPLEAMMHVQQQGEMGRQRGEQSRLGRLVSQGMSEPGGLAKIAPEVASFNPDAAFALQDRASGQLDKRREALTSRARVLSAMPAQQRAQVWPSIKAELAAVDPELGAALPDMYDEAQFGPVIEQLAGMGQQDQMPSSVREAMAFRADPSLLETRRQMYGSYSYGEVPLPDGTVAQSRRNSRTGEMELVLPGGRVVPMAGATDPRGGQGDGSMPTSQPEPQGGQIEARIAEAANKLLAANVPPEQVEQFVIEQHRASAPSGAKFGTGPTYSGPPISQPTPTTGAPGSGFGRRPEDEAAAVEAAKLQTQLRFAPQQAEADANRARMVKGAEAEASAVAAAKQEITGLRNQQRTITSAIKGLRDGKYKTGPQNMVIPDAFQSADNQVFITTINKAVLDEAAKLTGVISDKDMAFLQAATISMEKWPEANIEILEEVERILSDGIKAKEKLIQGAAQDSPEDDIDALLAEYGG